MIIGFAGRQQSGKDFCADMLMQLDERFVKRRFADSLKVEVEQLWPHLFSTATWESAGIEYREEYLPELKMTRRGLLQHAGKLKRTLDQDYFVKKTFENYDKETCHWIIPDVRFPNEIDGIRNAGGQVYLVHQAIVTTVNTKEDESETALLGSLSLFDGYVWNVDAELTKNILKHILCKIYMLS